MKQLELGYDSSNQARQLNCSFGFSCHKGIRPKTRKIPTARLVDLSDHGDCGQRYLAIESRDLYRRTLVRMVEAGFRQLCRNVQLWNQLTAAIDSRDNALIGAFTSIAFGIAGTDVSVQWVKTITLVGTKSHETDFPVVTFRVMTPEEWAYTLL